MNSIRFVQSQIDPAQPQFHQGDQVFLAKGTYQGTEGTFLHLRDDAKWADIAERNGSVRSHPVAWLAQGHGVAGQYLQTGNTDLQEGLRESAL